MSKDKSGFEGQHVTKGPRKKFEYSLKELLLGIDNEYSNSLSNSLVDLIKSKICD